MNARALLPIENNCFNILNDSKLCQATKLEKIKEKIAEIKAQQLQTPAPTLNAQDEKGHTLLYIAAKNNYADIVQVLIKEKVDLNKSNFTGSTALTCATFYDHIEIAIALIQAGADLNIQNRPTWGQTTALMIAVRKWSLTLILMKALLKAGADPNLQGDYGVTALDEALDTRWNNKLDMIMLLLEYKAVSNVRSVEGVLNMEDQNDPKVKYCRGLFAEQQRNIEKAKKYEMADAKISIGNSNLPKDQSPGCSSSDIFIDNSKNLNKNLGNANKEMQPVPNKTI